MAMEAFDVLGDPVRRRILEVLLQGEQAAGDVGALGVELPDEVCVFDDVADEPMVEQLCVFAEALEAHGLVMDDDEDEMTTDGKNQQADDFDPWAAAVVDRQRVNELNRKAKERIAELRARSGSVPVVSNSDVFFCKIWSSC